MGHTVGDVLKKMIAVQTRTKLFGPSREFIVNYNSQIESLAEAICRENEVTREQAMGLPQETQLGAESQLIFGELLRWLFTQHRMLKK